ncbi:MAG: UPF0104 family protein [Candidatus Schekmanbacteria bacterium]|nr:MAG: UPF0104 family protein [Candidatus Schekmanbacteria bacterium]
MAKEKKFRKRVTFSIILSAAVFAGLSLYGELPQLKKSILNFSWKYIPVIMVMVFLNYIIRFVKWDYYLKVINIKTSKKDSFSIFMSGLLMTVSPGKFGEVLKSYLLKKIYSTQISKSSPVILAERVTDLLAFCLLASFGAYSFHYGENVVLIGIVLIILIVLIIGQERIFVSILEYAKKFSLIEKYSTKIENAYESAASLLSIKNIFKPTAISIPSWFCECVAFYFILNGLGCNVNLFKATFIYSISTIIGALSMLPGGLAVMETSMTGMLVLVGVDKSSAVAATILIRCFTLWLAVITGMIFFYSNHRRFGDIDDAISESSTA